MITVGCLYQGNAGFYLIVEVLSEILVRGIRFRYDFITGDNGIYVIRVRKNRIISMAVVIENFK